jgi:LysM repeat protein
MRRHGPARLALFTGVALSALAAPARAGEHVHALATGESLASLASQYYGASWKAVYLVARNGLPGDRDVTVGTRLVIPACFTYRVRRGDSGADIARRYLGDRERYKVLMQENGIKDPSELAVGAELLMPFHLRHVVEPGDSWSRLAQRYYRNARRASILEDYNPAVKALSPGDRVTVPVFDRAALDVASRRPSSAKLGAAGLASASSAAAAAADKAAASASGAIAAAAAAAVAAVTGGGKAEAAPDASPSHTAGSTRAEIAKAVEDYRRGEFDTACPKLDSLLALGGLAQSDRATVVSYLGYCAVAYGNHTAAADYFKKWLEIDARAQLDPITTSPKILAVFQEVVESVRGEGEGR